jgi:hypothetical protein
VQKTIYLVGGTVLGFAAENTLLGLFAIVVRQGAVLFVLVGLMAHTSNTSTRYTKKIEDKTAFEVADQKAIEAWNRRAEDA